MGRESVNCHWSKFLSGTVQQWWRITYFKTMVQKKWDLLCDSYELVTKTPCKFMIGRTILVDLYQNKKRNIWTNNETIEQTGYNTVNAWKNQVNNYIKRKKFKQAIFKNCKRSEFVRRATEKAWVHHKNPEPV